MIAARHKSHVGAAGGEPGAEITADADRTHYGNFHAHAPCRSDRQDADQGGRYSIFWPFRAVAPAISGPVARMERSVIRGQPIPDYAALHPGHKAAMSFCPVADLRG